MGYARSLARVSTTVGTATVYTCPVGGRAMVRQVDAQNNGTTSRLIVVRIGGKTLLNVSLPPKAHVDWSGQFGHALHSGDTIVVQGDSVDVDVLISGEEGT